MKKSFKYYIKANKETIEKVNQVLELCRILYNCIVSDPFGPKREFFCYDF